MSGCGSAEKSTVQGRATLIDASIPIFERHPQSLTTGILPMGFLQFVSQKLLEDHTPSPANKKQEEKAAFKAQTAAKAKVTDAC